MRRYELVVFDWDGTLIDSIGSIVGCTEVALRDAGIAGVDREVIRGAIGLGLAESLERFLPGAAAEIHERLLEAYRHHWITSWGHVSQPFAATEAVLEGLAAAGHLLAVATAKSRRGLERDFARTGLGRHFHASRTADESGSKPSPRMLLEIMEELGVARQATLMIGDTGHDLEMAANAGVDAVAVASGAHPREVLVGYRPAACLDGVEALLAWLGLEPREAVGA